MICSRTTFKSPPLAKNPEINGGIVQGTSTINGSTNPATVAR